MRQASEMKRKEEERASVARQRQGCAEPRGVAAAEQTKAVRLLLHWVT